MALSVKNVNKTQSPSGSHRLSFFTMCLQLHSNTLCKLFQLVFDTAIRKNLPAVVSQTDFSPICHQNALAPQR
nr:MAG TPA: hypothetical protein [Bacteriophage sp.]